MSREGAGALWVQKPHDWEGRGWSRQFGEEAGA